MSTTISCNGKPRVQSRQSRGDAQWAPHWGSFHRHWNGTHSGRTGNGAQSWHSGGARGGGAIWKAFLVHGDTCLSLCRSMARRRCVWSARREVRAVRACRNSTHDCMQLQGHGHQWHERTCESQGHWQAQSDHHHKRKKLDFTNSSAGPMCTEVRQHWLVLFPSVHGTCDLHVHRLFLFVFLSATTVTMYTEQDVDTSPPCTSSSLSPNQKPHASTHMSMYSRLVIYTCWDVLLLPLSLLAPVGRAALTILKCGVEIVSHVTSVCGTLKQTQKKTLRESSTTHTEELVSLYVTRKIRNIVRQPTVWVTCSLFF